LERIIGGYARADAFAKHFAQHCRDCSSSSSSKVRKKLKTIVTPTIIWQGNSIQCTKMAITLQYEICMTKRKEILHQFCTNTKSKIIRFGGKLHIETLRTHSPQQKVNSRYSIFQAKKKQFQPQSSFYCQTTSKEAQDTPE
jgi:hypothetical protein